MKRIISILIILLSATALLPAASIDLSDFQASFKDFATEVAGTLSSTATTGLNWSDAYIGQFPNFGIGLTVGASMIPLKAVQPVFDMLNVSLPSELSFVDTWGVPVPAAVIDARIGGFFLPFDIGLKFGYLPEEAKKLLGNIQVDYLMAGADLRYGILKDEGLTPALSVGVGYSYYQGAIGLTGLLKGTSIDITDVMNKAGYSGSYMLSLSSPDLYFDWQSSVFEAKAQLSKKLLFITPSIGMSASYGISTAGGGVSSKLTCSSNTTLKKVQKVFEDDGYTAPTDQGISVSSDASGWAFRAFGGVGINILILDVDLNATYNILSGSLGGSANLRVQI